MSDADEVSVGTDVLTTFDENDNEIATDNIIPIVPKDQRRTKDILFKMEFVQMWNIRVAQIERLPTVEKYGFDNPHDIAREDIIRKVAPFIVRRYTGRGYELWSLRELRILDTMSTSLINESAIRDT
jgi:hypothetical protein